MLRGSLRPQCSPLQRTMRNRMGQHELQGVAYVVTISNGLQRYLAGCMEAAPCMQRTR